MSGRIVVIGNSFVGAVINALAGEPSLAGDYRFDFAGSMGDGFATIHLENGRFVNVRVSDRFRTGHIDDYDAVFIYGRLPSPHHLAARRNVLHRERYSRQVIDATLRDSLESSEQMPVYRHFKAAARVPVRMLAANVSTTLGALGRADHAEEVALIRTVLGEDYLEAPAALFTPELAPDKEYYRGSVTIEGRNLGEDRQARHDVNHLNVAGGAIVVRHLVEHLQALGIAGQDDKAVVRAAP